MKLTNLLNFCLLLIVAMPAQAKVENEPDSVFLFSYAHVDGGSGLKFAWSIDGTKWLPVADGFDYLKSDFGPWGSGKKMFRPQLLQSRKDGKWHCLWAATVTGETLAYTVSPDLLKWSCQVYAPAGERSKYAPVDPVPTAERKTMIEGREEDGWMQKTSYATVERLIRFADHKKYRQIQNEECMEQDPVRFAGLEPVEAIVRVRMNDAKPISEHLIGIFFEDINYSADGGLYAELIQNRDFEYAPTDRGNDRNWNSTHSWSVQGDGATLNIRTDAPIHPNNPHYAVLDVRQPGAALQNAGFDGIVVKKGEKYDFSLFSKAMKGKGGKVKVGLVDGAGRKLAQTVVSVSSKEWKQ